MAGPQRPRTSPVRTTLVDSEWVKATGQQEESAGGVPMVGDTGTPGPDTHALDFAQSLDDDVTVQTSAEEMLARSMRDADEVTEVTEGFGEHASSSEGDDGGLEDSLLASNEEQRLLGARPRAHEVMPPRRFQPSARSAPLPARSAPLPALPKLEPRRSADSLLESSLEPLLRVPHPQSSKAPVPVPPPPPHIVVPALGGEPSPAVSEPEPELSQPEIEELPNAVYSPPSRPPPRYSQQMDSSGVLNERASKGGGMARMVLVLGITLPLAVGLGVFIGMQLTSSKAPAVTAPSPSASDASQKKEEEKAPQTVVDRAAEGDFKAIDEIKKRPPSERTVEETIALARGRSQNKSLALEGFAAEIKKNPDVLKDAKKLERLKDFFLDRDTTNQAAPLLVQLPGPTGPDLLYEAWIATKNRSETTVLAEELLQTKEVKEKASPALSVALDLRAAQECEQFKEIVPRAAEKGDRRSLSLLGKLVSKRGCGPAKRDDCYECLRAVDDDKKAVGLTEAIKAVRGRPAPKY